MKLNRIKAVVVLCGLALAAPTFAADAGGGFKVGGFVDAQFGWNSVPASLKGFNVTDGAIKVMHEMGGSSFLLDVPFMSLAATSNAFVLGSTKAQAFVKHKYDGGVWWQLGQFDSIFGAEPNDTDENFFASLNAMDRSINFFTHTGLALGYTSGGMQLTLVGANLRDKGLNTNNANAMDVAAQIKLVSGSMNVRAGFLFNFLGATNGHILDVGAGMKMGDLALDAGFMMLLGLGTTSWGLDVAPIWTMSDKMGLGLRFAMTNIAAATTMEITVGPKYSFTKNLDAKLNYQLTNTTAMTHGVVASGVYHL